MQTWVASNGDELHFQPGKPVQNGYIESFNNRFRDECLSQHWFASLCHMRSVIQLARGLQPPPAAQRLGLRATGVVRVPLPNSRQKGSTEPRIAYDPNLRALDRSATKPGGSAVLCELWPRRATRLPVLVVRLGCAPAVSLHCVFPLHSSHPDHTCWSVTMLGDPPRGLPLRLPLAPSKEKRVSSL